MTGKKRQGRQRNSSWTTSGVMEWTETTLSQLVHVAENRKRTERLVIILARQTCTNLNDDDILRSTRCIVIAS